MKIVHIFTVQIGTSITVLSFVTSTVLALSTLAWTKNGSITPWCCSHLLNFNTNCTIVFNILDTVCCPRLVRFYSEQTLHTVECTSQYLWDTVVGIQLHGSFFIVFVLAKKQCTKLQVKGHTEQYPSFISFYTEIFIL